ncbi:MAG TPA: hypothetical protein VLA88_03045, partial [Candidatus Saccharimonadales bacterium]|nr:hypothetical protein [Candidatus Saccharimonadales bacterium]
FHLTRVSLIVPANLVLFPVFVEVLGWGIIVSQAICIALTMVVNYYAGDKLVYGTKLFGLLAKKFGKPALTDNPALCADNASTR